MKDLLEELEDRLQELRDQGLYRQLAPPKGIDFSSNDYLGLSRDSGFRDSIMAKLRRHGQGHPLTAPASRLLRGNTWAHQTLEKKLAVFKGCEAALLFPTGYQANIGVLTALLNPQDRVLSDAQNHASIIDGLRLSRCQKSVFPHRGIDSVREILATPHSEGKTFLVTESLFSMDGDIVPLDQYAELVQEYGAYLIVDDAHATGLFGDSRSSGLTESFRVETRCLAVVSTCGKAMGLFGAFVAGSQIVIDYLVNRCRPFIFTTALPPLLLCGVEAALEILASQPQRRQRVSDLAKLLRERLNRHGIDTLDSSGPIVPVVLGDNDWALEVAARLQAEGLDVRAVRPPTVAPGTSRLRISVHADHTEEEIHRLAEALIEATVPSRGLSR